ncbi:MAG: hypothetical protein KDC66_05410 [Phaeodactylibacter sp.]|nr:hypothetical protein [Phaeodactylibacter sp.]
MALSKNACTNILRLLASDNERNASLALQLLDSQQARPGFLLTLGAHLLTADVPARDYVQNCLKALAQADRSSSRYPPRPLQLILEYGKANGPAEADTTKAIEALHQLFGIDPLLLALHTYHEKGICGSLILRKGSSADIARLLESRIYQGPQGKTMALQALGMGLLPEGLADFKDVAALVLSGNQLSSLPSMLLKFRHLRHLDVRYNALGALPTHLLKLPRLECLDARRNNFRMPWLEYLAHPEKKRFLVGLDNTSGFALHELHAYDIGLILNNLSYRSDKGLVLGLAGQGLREVPEVLFQWRGLRVLDLRDNPVSILPAWLLRMPQLRAIYCDYGTEYNPAFRHQHLEVLRDSLAPLPPPAGWVERKAATGQNAIALPYELELPGRETENI